MSPSTLRDTLFSREQEDPLMPLLFSLAIHDLLAEAQRECGPQEHLFAFLDDVYATSDVPERTRTLYESLGTKLHAQAGIRLHTGKTRVWNRASLSSLGTPLGSQRFIQEVADKRLAEEQRLWDAIPTVPDLQVAQILLQCAGPRCHHMLRTLPPSQSEVYARGHDSAHTVGTPGDRHDEEMVHNIASLPMRMGSQFETGTQNCARSLLGIMG